MAKDVQTAISFTNYASLFSDAKTLFLALAALPAFVAGLFAFIGLDPRSAFTLSYLVLFLPSLAFIAIWQLIASKKYILSHGIAIATIGSAIMGVSMLLALILTGNPLSRDALLLGIPLVFVSSYYISFLISQKAKHAFLIATVLASFLALGFLGRANIDYKTLSMELLGASVFVIAISWVALQVISAPLKKRYGISITEVAGSLLGGWFYEGEKFEDLLEKIGKPIQTYVGMVDVKTKKGRFRIVVPYFHFGPFGDVGASRFPSMLRKELPNSLVLHGTATHDLNLTSKKEARKVISSISKAKFEGYNERFCFSKNSFENAKAYGLCFEDDVLCLLSRAPEVTEDIDLSGGLILIESLRRKFNAAIVADCHNSSAKKITYFTPLSPEFNEYYQAVAGLEKQRGKKMKAGFSKAKMDNPSVDEGGVAVAAFEGNGRALVISVDSNGISKKAKADIEKIGEERGFITLVCSTDSHGKNTVKGIVNEFKTSTKDIEAISHAIDDAISNMSEASASFSMEKVKVKVLGDAQVKEIMATLSSTWAVIKWVMPAAALLTATGLLLLF